MKKEFLTYLPIWRPMQTRSHLLWRYTYQSTSMAVAWFRILADVTDSAYAADMRGTFDEQELRASFIYTYARDSSPHAFALDEQTWQLAWAHNMDRTIQEQLKRPYWLHASNKSPADLLGLEMHITGIHPYSKKLKFHWVEIVGSLDADLTWDYLTNTMERVVKTYKRRWADPRYGFATPEACPVPTCSEDLIDMDPFYIGLVLDTCLFSFISRYSWQSSRCCHYWAINHMNYWLRTSDGESQPQGKAIIDALRLKPELMLSAVNGPYTERIQELAREARATMRTSWGFLYHTLPATIIEQMDSLVEEMCNASQHQRQQGQICESTTSPDGTSTN